MQSNRVGENAEPIVWRLHLSANPFTVFDTLNTDEGRASFWAESAVERYGSIEFHFISGHVESCKILEREPPVLFVIEYFGSRARFDLVSDGAGGTDLTLTNTNYAPRERDDMLAGWLNVLLPMKAAIDHSVDLRNHDRRRTWEHNYVDQ